MPSKPKKKAAPPPSDEGHRVLSVKIPVALHRRAKILAVQKNTTFQAILEQALSKHLDAQGA